MGVTVERAYLNEDCRILIVKLLETKTEIATSATAPIGAPPRNDSSKYNVVQGFSSQ